MKEFEQIKIKFKISSGPASSSFWNTKTPKQVSDILSPAEKTLAPEQNRGEENDTPVAKVASKGIMET